MLISKKNRRIVYEALFKEGVMVAKKDPNAAKHHTLEVPNLHVMKLMQSLKSRGYVKEQFNWGWFYWFLTNEGIEYLRDFLHLLPEVVPDTLKKPRTAARAPSAPTGRGAPEKGADRGARRPFGGEEKKLGAPSGDFKPDFRGGGYGRGGFRGRDGGYRRDGAPSEGRGFGRGAPRQ